MILVVLILMLDAAVAFSGTTDDHRKPALGSVNQAFSDAAEHAGSGRHTAVEKELSKLNKLATKPAATGKPAINKSKSSLKKQREPQKLDEEAVRAYIRPFKNRQEEQDPVLKDSIDTLHNKLDMAE